MNTPLSPITPLLALPVCVLGLRLTEEQIEEIIFLPPGAPLQQSSHILAQRFQIEIERYLAQPDYRIQIPIMKRGSLFQNQVWRSISEIPSGQTRSYGEIAKEIASAPRAVGQACGANPFPIFIPCHRVIGKHTLGGFAKQNSDWLIKTKQWLLAHENLK